MWWRARAMTHLTAFTASLETVAERCEDEGQRLGIGLEQDLLQGNKKS